MFTSPIRAVKSTPILYTAWDRARPRPASRYSSIPRSVPTAYSAYDAGLGWAPSDMIASWAEDGTTVSFPIASLQNLTAITADGAGGDARQVALSMCQTMFEWFNELDLPPEAVRVRLTGQTMQRSGDFDGKHKQTFQFDFYTLYPEDTIADEPT